jgi:hypothetical protein
MRSTFPLTRRSQSQVPLSSSTLLFAFSSFPALRDLPQISSVEKARLARESAERDLQKGDFRSAASQHRPRPISLSVCLSVCL